MAEKDDKISRIIRTARTMKLSKEQMKNEKDNIEKELEEIKGIPFSFPILDLFYYFLPFKHFITRIVLHWKKLMVRYKLY